MILDLTVRRFRQIVAAIRRRHYLKRREDIALLSWQTRQLASFTAGGYMTDGKHGNPALDFAQTLAYDEIEKLQIEEAQERAEKNGTSRSDNLAFDENGDIIPLIPNLQPATYERFMGSMGSPDRWAGGR